MVIAHREEFVLTRRKPLVARMCQTLGTVPIPTRVVRDGAMATAVTAIEMTALRSRATAREGAEHAVVLRRQLGPVCLDKAIAVLSDDVGHLEGWPAHRFCFRRERRTVSGLETGIVSSGLGTAWR
jgi:hypothetical protein